MTNPNSSLNSSEDPPPSQWKCTKVKGIHIPCKNPWLAPAVVFTDVSNCMPMCARHCTRPKGKIVSKIQFQLKILKEFKTPREVPQFSLVLSWFFPQLKAHRELTHRQTRTIWCNFQTLQDALELWEDLMRVRAPLWRNLVTEASLLPGSACLGDQGGKGGGLSGSPSAHVSRILSWVLIKIKWRDPNKNLIFCLIRFAKQTQWKL